ncbi:hypothetical protein [Aquimarina muelleri]|nr:hypothetical protein [Aquimarina muelleri]MCX2761564.1 hypothetical protein [Aquimarina muelleri]
MFTPYIHLDTDQKEVVCIKVAIRTKAAVKIVEIALGLVNPE